MSMTIIERHFPGSNWKKYYSKIIFHTISVFHHLKPAFLWDFGPVLSTTQIFNFVKECKIFFKLQEPILVIDIDNHIIVACVNQCLRNLKKERLFIEIKQQNFLLKTNAECKVNEVIEFLETQLENCIDCDLLELAIIDTICLPCLFGLMLDYPLVYYFERDYNPFPVCLKVFVVFCNLSFENVSGKFKVYSFSVPEILFNSHIDHFVSFWFDGLQFSGENIFSNLSLECRIEDIKINSHFLRAFINLENVSNFAVERWHFRMLNDKQRNDAFRKAIIKKIKMGFDQVLDVGTGTGLLSLFCVEGGAKDIYACDSSPTMITIAENVLCANNANGVRLIPKHSSDLSLREDISGRVSLLITETFDAGLLGEGIVETLNDAWENLLLPPRSTSQRFGTVIPNSATLYLTGIECDAIADNFYLKANDYVNNVRSRCESYDTCDLKLAQCVYITEIVKIFKIDFNDPACIKKLTGDCEWKLTLTCKSPGRLDCFAVWFDLHLDEDIFLNTSPGNENNVAWDQAIFPLQRQKFVNAQQQLQIIITYKDKLSIALDEKIEIREIPEEAVRILNDQTLTNVSRRLADLLVRERTLSGPTFLLDTFPFPLFGLDLINLRKVTDNKLCCEISKFDWESMSPILDHLSNELKFSWSSSFGEEKFDIIFANFIETTGELKDDIPSLINYFQSLLKPDGMLIPEKITVVGQFIHSEFLTRASKVTGDDVTCGYKIAEFINHYQVQHYIDLDFRSMEKTIYCEPFDLFDVFDSFDAPAVIERVAYSVSPCNRANALIYWFRIRLKEDLEFSTNQGFYHQAGFLFPEISGSEILFKIIHSSGLFNLEFLRS